MENEKPDLEMVGGSEDEVSLEELTRGLTFYVTIGAYSGWGLHGNTKAVRLELGWVVFGIVRVDIEILLGIVHHVLGQLRENDYKGWDENENTTGKAGEGGG